MREASSPTVATETAQLSTTPSDLAEGRRAPRVMARLFERRTMGLALVLGTFAAALLVQSVFFVRAGWMLGDLSYHRGVAYTMLGGMVQGEGPYAGMLSYYGGLYPQAMALATEITGRPFDTVVSAASWIATLLLPAALLLLGRMVWRDDWFAIGLFVLVGTFAAPLTTNADQLWVNAVLPSASSYWPVYPRDVAIALMAVAIAALLAERRAIRILGLGITAGVLVMFHAQIAILFAWLIFVFGIYRTVRLRSITPFIELAASGAIAAVVAAWWWIPRFQAALSSNGVLLADYPGQLKVELDLPTFISAFGTVGVISVAVLLVAPWVLRRDRSLDVFVVWVLAFVPLIVVHRLLPGIEVFTERRLLLVASVGMVGLATGGLVLLGRRLPAWSLPVLVTVAIVLPSLPATRATLGRIDDVVDNAWRPGTAGVLRRIDVATWNGAMANLREAVRAERGTEVLTYDSAAAWAWSFSGAQVYSLWLPGPFKLGFDLTSQTGLGYLDRNARLQAAYDNGRAGVCSLAESEQIRHMLVETQDGQIVDYDRSLGSPYRVEPADRDAASINRTVAPGVRYVDLGSADRLELDAGASVTIPWEAEDIERVGLQITDFEDSVEPLVTIDTGTVIEDHEGLGAGGQRWVHTDTPGVHGVTITALRPAALTRLVGLTTMDLSGLPWAGYAAGPTDRFCPAGGVSTTR